MENGTLLVCEVSESAKKAEEVEDGPELAWKTIRLPWAADGEGAENRAKNRGEKKNSRGNAKNLGLRSEDPEKAQFSGEFCKSSPGIRIADVAGRVCALVEVGQKQALADLRTRRVWAVAPEENFEALVDDLGVARESSALVRLDPDSLRIRAKIELPGRGRVSGLVRVGRTRFACVRGSEKVYFEADSKRGSLELVSSTKAEESVCGGEKRAGSGEFAQSEKSENFKPESVEVLVSTEFRGSRARLCQNRLVFEDVHKSTYSAVALGSGFSCHLLQIFDRPRGVSIFHSGTFGCELFEVSGEQLVLRARWVQL